MKMKLKIVLTPILATMASLVLFGSTVSAATFNQNDIIDDQVFNNTSTMSVQSINNFLNQFPSSCISPNNGFSAPDPTGYSPGGGYVYGGQVTAGQVIYDAANAYGLNPEVILSTLQKEQSLVTGTSGCSVLRYTGAMGYGCPDGGTDYNYTGLDLYSINGSMVGTVNGTCVNTAAKAGFSQQVIHGTWLLKFGEQRSEGNMSWDVQLTNSPESGDRWDNSDDPQSCYGGPMTQGTYQVCPSGASTYYDGYDTIDGTAVHMDSGATAALYWYTPHFSGNQNFFNLFTGWFGSTTVAGYAWQLTSEYAYTDSTKTTPVNLSNLTPGEKVYIGFTAKNTGSQTWSNTGPNAVLVGTEAPKERNSIFAPGSGWLSPTRPALLQQSSVAPGATGTFEFYMTVPTTPGSGGVYNERFNLIATNLTWFNDTGLSYYMSFPNPTYSWQLTSEYAYTDSTKSTTLNINNIAPGQKFYVGFTAKNTGNVTWSNTGVNAVMVGTNAPQERSSVFSPGSGWLSPTRPALMQESSVAPGGTGTFEFYMTAPSNLTHNTVYNERFNLISNGVAWFNDTGLSYYLNVAKPIYSWQLTSEYAYTDSTKSTVVDINNVQPGQKMYVGFTAKNTGNMTWSNTGANPIMVGTEAPEERSSVFSPGSSWLSGTRPALMQEPSVAPGATGAFEFYMTAPNISSQKIYNERFNLIANGLTWLNDTGLSYYFNVQ